VHMMIDADMTKLLCEQDPTYKDFVTDKGEVVVQLDRALYGICEAGLMWYRNISSALFKLGYTCNEYDQCVFNKYDENGIQITIGLHVDDLLITSESDTLLDEIEAYLRETYGDITVKTGLIIDYIGMTFDFREEGKVRVTMNHCIQDILSGCGVEGTAATPAGESLFDVRETTLATAEEQKWFHSYVAKMLYLSKRVKPECLTCVSFLSTRVSRCDSDDLRKLKRLLRYLRGTADRGIVLEIGDDVKVIVYVDAAYGVHTDSGKSHSGCAVMVGVGTVSVTSSKQHIVTKSSTEAEIVALSDCSNPGIHLRNFLMEQGYEVTPCEIMQDNTSTMALIRRGSPGASGSRHINIRYFWLKDRVDQGEVTIHHMPTERMVANVLTKPVQGAQFIRERDMLTNW
jgi:hypothetical protein